nr:reverse transcriptase domain-containing protein [Tanacetum cinerariifolium]
MYLTSLTESISALLLAEREKRQVPIYFVSRILQGARINYLELEKLILALVHAIKRLRMYFQAYPIRVLTDKPIKKIFARPEKTRRIVDVVFDGAFGGVRDEEDVLGEGVVVISSSLDMLTNSYLRGIMVSLIFLEGLDEEALVEFMVE